MGTSLADTFSDFLNAGEDEACCYCGKGEEAGKLHESTLDGQVTTRYHEACKIESEAKLHEEAEERNRRNQIAYAIDADEE